MSGSRGVLRLHDALYLGGLLCLVALFIWPAWRQPYGLWYAPGAAFSDQTVTFWPNMRFLSESVREWGEVPLWRPLIMGGTPFLGNPQSGLFYPPNWLFALLPTSPTFHLLYALHLFGAGAAMYGLLRWSYGGSPFAAFFAGVSYAFTPKVIAHMGAGHYGIVLASAWLPPTVWLLRGAVAQRSICRAAGCGAALAMAYILHPGIAFYVAVLLGAYAAYRLIGTWRASGGRNAARLAARLAFVPLALLLVGAVQFVPSLELAGNLTRSRLTLAEAGRDSLPWRYLLGYLIADRGGYHEWMTYLGLVPLGLAALAVWRSRRPERWFWAGLALVSLLYSLGTNGPLYPLFYRLLPTLGWVRVPPRALLLAAFAAALLAAWGIDALGAAEWSPRERRWLRLGATAGLLICAGLGVGFALLLNQEIPAQIAAFAAIGAGLMTALILSIPQLVPSLVPRILLAALLLADLWPVGRSLVTLRPAQEVFAEGAGPAAYLAGQAGLYRTYSPSYSIRQHVAARFGLEQLDGVDPAQLRWTARYMSLAGGVPISGYGVTVPYFPDGADVHTVWRKAVPNASLLGFLNGRYVVAEYPIDAPGLDLLAQIDGSYLYVNRRALPRAFTVTQVETADGWEQAQDRLAAGYDPARGALVEGGHALDGRPGHVEARVQEHAPNQIVVEAEVAQPALLVLSEVWYPGWEVTVDGQTRPQYRVDGIVRGVYLEPGAHVVTWQYRPASLRWGLAITLGAAVAWGIGCVLWRR